jgi:hypothetical protein
MYKMAGIFSQRSTRYDYLMVRAERKQRAKKGKPGRWKQPEIQATAKEAAEIAAQIEADLERRLEDMRRPGAIEDDRQHFSAYSEEVCGRKRIRVCAPLAGAQARLNERV